MMLTVATLLMNINVVFSSLPSLGKQVLLGFSKQFRVVSLSTSSVSTSVSTSVNTSANTSANTSVSTSASTSLVRRWPGGQRYRRSKRNQDFETSSTALSQMHFYSVLLNNTLLFL